MQTLDQKLAKRIISSIVFALCFSVVGNTLPDIYYEHIDQTEYYTIKQPAMTQKQYYNPCEVVVVEIIRSATINATAESQVELILLDEKGVQTKKKISEGEFNIERSTDQAIQIPFELPCSTTEGKYYIQALVKYEIRNVPKIYVWRSEEFVVKTEVN